MELRRVETQPLDNATQIYLSGRLRFIVRSIEGVRAEKGSRLRKGKARKAKVPREFRDAMIEGRGSAEAPIHPSKEAAAARPDVNKKLIAIGLDPVSVDVIEKILRPKKPLRMMARKGDTLYAPPKGA